MHKSETLENLSGKKAARAVLDQRIRESQNRPNETDGSYGSAHRGALWRPYLDRKQVKPSTKRSYDCEPGCTSCPLSAHAYPEVAPFTSRSYCSRDWQADRLPKTVRNLVGLLQSIFSLAVDNYLIPRSPVRDRHKPQYPTRKACLECRAIKADCRLCLESPPQFISVRDVRLARGLGELLGLQWKNIDFDSQALDIIRQALWEGELVAPKTEGSVRVIYFGPSLLFALRRRNKPPTTGGQDDFVFCKDDGPPPHPDVLRRDALYPT